MTIAMTALVGNALADLIMALHEHPDVYAKVQVRRRLHVCAGVHVFLLKPRAEPVFTQRLCLPLFFVNPSQAEVLDKLGPDRTVPLTSEALNRLSYSRAVVDETRRLFPFVAGMLGQVHKGFDLTAKGRTVHVPPNSTVVGAFYLTQHSPEEWSEPLAFKPERFLAGEPTSGGGWMSQAEDMCALPQFRTLSNNVRVCNA